jgi:periplasmic copper chaperone A
MQRLRKPLYAFALTAALLAGAPAMARDYTLKSLTIVNPNARATPPGARTGGAYLTIENHGKDNDQLVRASSPVADSTELHTMRMEGGVMHMRAVTSIGIPAGATMSLAPGGYHVMFIGLKKPLVAGQAVPLALTFAKAGTVDVEVTVAPLDSAASPPPTHGMGMPASPPAH